MNEFIKFVAPGLDVQATEKHGRHNQQSHAGKGGGGAGKPAHEVSGRLIHGANGRITSGKKPSGKRLEPGGKYTTDDATDRVHFEILRDRNARSASGSPQLRPRDEAVQVDNMLRNYKITITDA